MVQLPPLALPGRAVAASAATAACAAQFTAATCNRAPQVDSKTLDESDNDGQPRGLCVKLLRSPTQPPATASSRGRSSPPPCNCSPSKTLEDPGIAATRVHGTGHLGGVVCAGGCCCGRTRRAKRAGPGRETHTPCHRLHRVLDACSPSPPPIPSAPSRWGASQVVPKQALAHRAGRRLRLPAPRAGRTTPSPRHPRCAQLQKPCTTA